MKSCESCDGLMTDWDYNEKEGLCKECREEIKWRKAVDSEIY